MRDADGFVVSSLRYRGPCVCVSIVRMHKRSRRKLRPPAIHGRGNFGQRISCSSFIEPPNQKRQIRFGNVIYLVENIYCYWCPISSQDLLPFASWLWLVGLHSLWVRLHWLLGMTFWGYRLYLEIAQQREIGAWRSADDKWEVVDDDSQECIGWHWILAKDDRALRSCCCRGSCVYSARMIHERIRIEVLVLDWNHFVCCWRHPFVRAQTWNLHHRVGIASILLGTWQNSNSSSREPSESG